MKLPEIEQRTEGGPDHKIIRGEDFFISYIKAGSGPTGDETALVSGDYTGDETKTYYILNGNWLEQYQNLVPKGYKSCKKLFDKNKKQYKSFWSN